MIRGLSKFFTTCFVSIVFIAIGVQPALSLVESDSDLPNFGQVTETLYRGGQPTSTGFAELKTMGVGLVINFREEPSETAAEKHQVESLGMAYIGIPWNAHDTLSNAEVLGFLETIQAHPETKVFIHCKRGADRTGLMVAAYRIAVEHKEVADALAEMHQFHFAGFSHPQLSHYVKALPALMQSDPAFRAFVRMRMPADGGTGRAN